MDDQSKNLLKIRVFDVVINNLTSVGTVMGGYSGHTDITNQITDIADRVITKTVISLGESGGGATNLGGFCYFQGDTNIIRLASNRSYEQKIRVTVFYV